MVPGSESIIYVDTVGFISDLPTTLIESFKATLDDLKSADLLLHVVDVSDKNFKNKIHEVNKVLSEIKADDIPQILVRNKIDINDYDENDIERETTEDSSSASEREIDDSDEVDEMVNEPSGKISEEDEFDMRLRKLLDRK